MATGHLRGMRRREAIGLAAATPVAVPFADGPPPVASDGPPAPRPAADGASAPAPAAAGSPQQADVRTALAARSEETPGPAPQAGASGVASALAAGGIPSTASQTYVRAAEAGPASCSTEWPLVPRPDGWSPTTAASPERS